MTVSAPEGTHATYTVLPNVAIPIPVVLTAPWFVINDLLLTSTRSQEYGFPALASTLPSITAPHISVPSGANARVGESTEILGEGDNHCFMRSNTPPQLTCVP